MTAADRVGARGTAAAPGSAAAHDSAAAQDSAAAPDGAAAHDRAAAQATAALAGEGLGLQLGGRTVVDGVSVQLPAGQWTALVGPNGAGKSSLLALLAGLRAPE